MSRPDFIFEITKKVGVHADYDQKRVVISCKTKDGKSVHLEADYQTLEKIHEEIRKQLDRL